MFDYISMRATVAGAHDNLIGGTEFARHGVEGMRESGSSHRVRQSSRTDRLRFTNALLLERYAARSFHCRNARIARCQITGLYCLCVLYAREGIRISNCGCKGSESFADLQVLEGKILIL